ncbi:helix-turn-helix domain-containing protein [Cohnella sp.]|uniref:helix-turn-helix domain-containing protein n=1 Tax=Cohnella sp. TaxID=1883426 RepID=UPI00356A43F3
MEIPDFMKLGSYSAPFYIEYVKRASPYNMQSNHFHPYYEVYLLLSGKRVYFIKDSTYSVEAGDLVFINKHEVHKTLNAGESGHERIVIHFDDRFISDVFKQHASLLLSPFDHQSPIVRLPPDNREQLNSLIKRMLRELRDKPAGYELFFSQAITDLLLMCSRYVVSSIPPESVYVTPIHRKISEVVRYLNANFGESTQIQQLAARFFISPYYLSRIFKEVTGFTLIDYLNLTRVKEAQRLLRETSLSVTAIATRVGFDNFSHFGKMFKRITRTSARDYRKEYSVKRELS